MNPTAGVFRHAVPFLLIVLFGILTTAELSAQKAPYQPDICAAGRTYILAFPDTVANSVQGSVNPMESHFYVYVYSGVGENKVMLSGSVGNFRQELTLQAGKTAVIELTKPLFDNVNEVGTKTFRLDAEEPVLVYCYMTTIYGGEAWTPIPVESWGREYFAAAIPGEIIQGLARSGNKFKEYPRPAPSFVMVVAAFNGTTVAISPTGPLDGIPQLSVLLNAGEAYLVQSFINIEEEDAEQADLGGTRIFANNPVGVITGNSRVQVVDDVPGMAKNSLKGMMVEWIAPTETHGTEFVYMPTWDSRHITGNPEEDIDQLRKAEYIRMFGTSGGPTTGVTSVGTARHTDPPASFNIGEGAVNDFRADGLPRAYYFTTEQPSQAYMYSTSVSKQNNIDKGGWAGWGAKGDFESWVPYMTEMVPREQWTGFAPFVIPEYPPMETYVNIVTQGNWSNRIYLKGDGDSETLVEMNRGYVFGSNLAWGTIALGPGTYYLVARDDAEFYAVCYGLRAGYERYSAGGWSGSYNEVVGHAFGYPLAPRRAVLQPGDSLAINTSMGCSDMDIAIRPLGKTSVGLRSVALDRELSENARLVYKSTADALGVIGMPQADVQVTPVDRSRDAAASVVIHDRTGKEWRVDYTYFAERLEVNPGRHIDFGKVTPNLTYDQDLIFTNPLGRDVEVTDLERLAAKDSPYEIVSVEPALPTTLKPGEKLIVKVQCLPTEPGKIFGDSLRLELNCSEIRITLRGESLSPCLNVADVHFGSIRQGKQVTRVIPVCNSGDGVIKFGNESNDALTWADRDHFTVSQGGLDSLLQASLGNEECVYLAVTFNAVDTGQFRTVARFWTNMPGCKDSTIWEGYVQAAPDTVSSAVPALGEIGAVFKGVEPNPFSGNARVHFTLASAGHVLLTLYDGSGRKVATLRDARTEPGEHALLWNADDLPSGLYYCRLTIDGRSETRAVLLVR